MNLLSAQTRFSPVSLLFVLLIVVGCKTTPINTAQTSPIPPRLIEPLKFVNFTVSQINSLEGISNLMSAKVSIKQDSVLGDYDWASFTGSPGTTNHAETINEFRAGVEHDFSARYPFDRIKYNIFKSVSDALDFMAKAKSSKANYLPGNYCQELPVSILAGNLGSDDWEQIINDAGKGMTLKDYAKTGHPNLITDIRTAGNTLTFYDTGNKCDYVVKELARGDVDEDGCEDVLIAVSMLNQDGNGGYYQAYVVSRTDPKQRQLKLVEFGAAK